MFVLIINMLKRIVFINDMVGFVRFFVGILFMVLMVKLIIVMVRDVDINLFLNVLCMG